VEFDDTAPTTDISLAELSRPRREFKEDAKKNNMLCGRKLKEKNKKKDAKLTNWFNPLHMASARYRRGACRSAMETKRDRAGGTKAQYQHLLEAHRASCRALDRPRGEGAGCFEVEGVCSA
jgi:hypothetical protein